MAARGGLSCSPPSLCRDHSARLEPAVEVTMVACSHTNCPAGRLRGQRGASACCAGSRLRDSSPHSPEVRTDEIVPELPVTTRRLPGRIPIIQCRGWPWHPLAQSTPQPGPGHAAVVIPPKKENALPDRAPPEKASGFSGAPTIVPKLGLGLCLPRFHAEIPSGDLTYPPFCKGCQP